MKPIKEKDLRDFKIQIIKSKIKYMVTAMEFRQRASEEKQRTRKSRIKINYGKIGRSGYYLRSELTNVQSPLSANRQPAFALQYRSPGYHGSLAAP